MLDNPSGNLLRVYFDRLAVHKAVADGKLPSFKEWSGIGVYKPEDHRARLVEYRDKVVLPFLSNAR